MNDMMLEADYHIISRPVSIKVTCPYCHWEISFPFEDIDEDGSSYHGWPGTVGCPECDNEFALGEADYD